MSTLTPADTPTVQPVAPTEIGALRSLGAWFVAASVLWWIAAAALIPDDDFFLGETARDEALSIAQHDGLFRAFHVVAALGSAAGAVGVVLLARWLRARRRSRLADAAAIVAVVAFGAWIVEVAIRMTATVSQAHDVASGARLPTDEPAIGSWIVFAAAALGFLMPMVCSWVLAHHRTPGRRSSMIVAGLVTLVTVAGVVTLAPSVGYQFGLLPFGLTLVLAHRRTSRSPLVSPVGSMVR